MSKKLPVKAATTASVKRSAARGPQGYVLVIRHRDQFRLEPVTRGEVVIGRDPSCTITLDDDSISRKHARISFGRTITIADLGSRNGTSVGGVRLQAKEVREVTPGEAIAVAEIQVFIQRAPKQQASSPIEGVIIRDPAMKRLYAALDVVAPSPLRILVLGETGVGKDVLARAIHAKSPRAHKPFVAINCGALAESMLESELFGHEKGAFTGAVQAKPGLFEAANGGTVFLDEVGELSPATQAKLLRVLESGEVMRVGSVATCRVDVRVVAATNRDLRSRVDEGQFRQDLYFRINGMTMTVPPLRDRPDDIEPLGARFAAAMAENLGTTTPAIDREALALLESHSWPGNVRELKNVIERAVVLRRGATISAGDLDLDSAPTTATPPRGKLWSDVELLEHAKIVDALNVAGGNQSAAAKQLGIARATLIKRIERFQIARPKKR